MPSFVFIILRLLVIFAIGLVTYMVLTKLITWPQRSKAKRTGQIVEDQTDDKSKIIKIISIYLDNNGGSRILNHKVSFVKQKRCSHLSKINIPLDKFIHFYIHNQNFIHIKGG